MSDAPPPPRKKQATCPAVLDQGSTEVESELTESSESGGSAWETPNIQTMATHVHEPCNVFLESLRACVTDFERIGRR